MEMIVIKQPYPEHGSVLNTLRPRQNGRHFPDNIFKCIFLNENAWISIKISLKFVPKGPINKIPALVQIMAWRRSGDKPLSESMMVNLLTHICVTRPQWVNWPGTYFTKHLEAHNTDLVKICVAFYEEYVWGYVLIFAHAMTAEPWRINRKQLTWYSCVCFQVAVMRWR